MSYGCFLHNIPHVSASLPSSHNLSAIPEVMFMGSYDLYAIDVFGLSV